MLRRLSLEEYAALLLALARTAFCGYRAAHQSITIDEAYAYESFLRGPWSSLYDSYNAANHILYSIFAKLCITIFGLSEFALRLPSVVGGFFMVLGIYAILAATVPSLSTRWIALTAISLHPLLLDFSVAARGYGLAVAFLMGAIYLLIRGGFAQRRCEIGAGFLLGLSVSANLVAAFPGVGLLACPLLLGTGSLMRRERQSAFIGLPFLVTAGAICYPAMSQATTGNFYYGLPTIGLSLFSLVSTSLRGRLDSLGWFGSERGVQVVQFYFLPVVAVFILVGAVKLVRQHLPRIALIPMVTLTGALLALVGAHYIVGLGYPTDRVGLCLVPLFGLAWAIATTQFPVSVRAIHALLAGALLVQMATQLKSDSFAMWAFNLSDKEIAKRIREETAGRPPQSVSLSAHWLHQNSLEFYRELYKIDALRPVERQEPTLYRGFDYYVFDLPRGDQQAASQRPYTELLREPLTGVILAREPAAP